MRETPGGQALARAIQSEKSFELHLRRVACVTPGHTMRYRLYVERSDGSIDLQVARALYEAPRCAYCARRLADQNRSIDHVVPLERGGLHVRDNVVPACRLCNHSKGKHMLDEWEGPEDLWGVPTIWTPACERLLCGAEAVA
jgi:5-methylcytosine-specific restriction endonuclease McrA